MFCLTRDETRGSPTFPNYVSATLGYLFEIRIQPLDKTSDKLSPGQHTDY